MGFTGKLTVVESIDSTLAELMRAPKAQAVPGTALLALTQTAGRGRSDRLWESPLGGVYLSVVIGVKDPRGLSLLGALAGIRLLEKFGLAPRLRWPNDLMIGSKKIAGLLPVTRYCGNELERAVLGVGLNVAQNMKSLAPELQNRATTLELSLGGRILDVVDVAKAYLDHLYEELPSFDSVAGLVALTKRCEPYLEGLGENRKAVVVHPTAPPRVMGPLSGLAPDGALLFEGGQRLDSLGLDERLRFSDESLFVSRY